jgi:hypothetical protein
MFSSIQNTQKPSFADVLGFEPAYLQFDHDETGVDPVAEQQVVPWASGTLRTAGFRIHPSRSSVATW